MRRTFMDLFMSGEVKDTDAEDYVDAWHEEDSGIPLDEYLGMTWEEYGDYFCARGNDLRHLKTVRNLQKEVSDLKRKIWELENNYSYTEHTAYRNLGDL